MDQEYSFYVSYHAVVRYIQKVSNDIHRKERDSTEISDIILNSIMQHGNLEEDLERNFLSGVHIINPQTNEDYGLFNVCTDKMLKKDFDYIISTIFPVERNPEIITLAKSHPHTKQKSKDLERFLRD